MTGVKSNRDAVGAKLTLHTTQGTMVRQIKRGVSYLSSSDIRVFWGLPDKAKVKKLVVRWPRGDVQEIVAPPTERVMTIVEPVGDDRPTPEIPVSNVPVSENDNASDASAP